MKTCPDKKPESSFYWILADFSIGFSRPQRPLLPLGAHKRKRLGNHQITKPFHQSGWQDSNLRPHAPQTRTLNRAELHPELFRSANIRTFALQKNEMQIFFHSSAKNRLKISRYSILTMSKYAPFGLKKFSTSILPCVIIPLWKRRPPSPLRGKGIINVETGRK